MRIPSLVSLLCAALAAGAASFGLSATRPSADFASYVLFATDQVRTRGLTVLDGNIGVNTGGIEVRRELLAERSQVSAKATVFLPPSGTCAVQQLFANEGADANPCGVATPFTPPILGSGVLDLGRACQFPTAPLQCDDSALDRLVAPGETVTLQPGTHRNVFIRGSSGDVATLVFPGGDYTLCTLRATRETRLLFTGPATVRVVGDIRIGDRSFTGPTAGALITAKDIRFLSTGLRLSFRQRAEAHALFCSPSARARIGPRVVIEGQVAARAIRIDRDVTVGLSGTLSGSTTTTPVPTTTSTSLAVCGNGRRDGAEVCDPPDFGNATCPGSSVAGAFLQCRDACARIDFNSCPGAPTSTTTSSSTSTSRTTTSSTSTLPPPRCGDGIKNGAEACDPPDFGETTCPGGTIVGQSLGCSADCMTVDFSECPPTATETCGNCVDDDGNGLTDFEDPACCAQARTFRMTLSKGRIIPGAGSSKLRLRAILARAGLARVDPRVQDVFLQVKSQQGGDVLCAQAPASRFVAKGRAFKFVDKLATVPSARGVSVLVVRIRPDGSVRFKARGKQVQLGEAQAGTMQVTVGFRAASASGSETRCSTTTQAFRSSPKGGLLTP